MSICLYLFALISKRSSAIRNIPFQLLRGENEISDLPFPFDVKAMMGRVSISLDLYAQAYLFIVRNRSTIKGVQWFKPTSVSLDIDQRYGRGLLGFKRGAKEYYRYDSDTDRSPDGLAWIWLEGIEEVGPGIAPADVAKGPAQVLRNIDKMASAFFERGAIGQFLVTAENFPPEPERKRLKSYLSRLFRGVDSAYGVEVIRGPLQIEKISSDPKDLALSELDADNRRDLTAIFTTPEPLITGQAGGLSRATLTRLTEQWYEDTIIPQAKHIVRAFNHHILNSYGYSIELQPQAMTIDQENERRRAQAFSTYVGAGVNPEAAAVMLGLDIPSDKELLNG